MDNAKKTDVREGAPSTVQEAQAAPWNRKRWKDDYIWLLEKCLNLEQSVFRIQHQYQLTGRRGVKISELRRLLHEKQHRIGALEHQLEKYKEADRAIDASVREAKDEANEWRRLYWQKRAELTAFRLLIGSAVSGYKSSARAANRANLGQEKGAGDHESPTP